MANVDIFENEWISPMLSDRISPMLSDRESDHQNFIKLEDVIEIEPVMKEELEECVNDNWMGIIKQEREISDEEEVHASYSQEEYSNILVKPELQDYDDVLELSGTSETGSSSKNLCDKEMFPVARDAPMKLPHGLCVIETNGDTKAGPSRGVWTTAFLSKDTLFGPYPNPGASAHDSGVAAGCANWTSLLRDMPWKVVSNIEAIKKEETVYYRILADLEAGTELFLLCDPKHDKSAYLGLRGSPRMGKDPLKCPHCEHYSSDFPDLKQHIQLQHRRKGRTPKPIKTRCENLTKVNNNNELKSTRKSEKSEQPNKPPSVNVPQVYKVDRRPKPHVCSKCGRRFVHYNNYTNHRLMHSENSHNACQQCGKRFVSSRDLKRHVLTHTGQKPFKCSECDTSFSQIANLKRHRAIHHAKDAAYQCSFCEKHFAYKSAFMSHINVHMRTRKHPPNDQKPATTPGAIDMNVSPLRRGRSAVKQNHRMENTDHKNDLFQQDNDQTPRIIKQEKTEGLNQHLEEPINECEIISDNIVNINNTSKQKSPRRKYNSLSPESGNIKQRGKRKKSDQSLMQPQNELQGTTNSANPMGANSAGFVANPYPDMGHHNINPNFYAQYPTHNYYNHIAPGYMQYYPPVPPFPNHPPYYMANPYFSCSECGEYFPSELHLNIHKQKHKKNLKCPDCELRFSSADQLDAHRLTHLKQLKCPDCEQSFSSGEQLDAHRLTHLKQLKCPECDLSFPSMKLLEAHRVVHPLQFKCPDCDLNFPTKEHLEAHKLTHLKRIKCPDCDLKFTSKEHLDAHRLSHMKQERYQCSQCGMEYVSLRGLRLHMHSHNTGNNSDSSNSPSEMSPSEPNGSYPCSHCNGFFSSELALKNHMKRHTSEKKHVCSVCSKAFIVLRDLKRHELTHTQEKPHRCGDCGLRFSQIGNLHRHRRTAKHTKIYKRN